MLPDSFPKSTLMLPESVHMLLNINIDELSYLFSDMIVPIIQPAEPLRVSFDTINHVLVNLILLVNFFLAQNIKYKRRMIIDKYTLTLESSLLTIRNICLVESLLARKTDPEVYLVQVFWLVPGLEELCMEF